MLERDTFIVHPSEGRERGRSFAIMDDEGEPLGRAVEVVTFWISLLRPLLGRKALPYRIVLRERLDDSLLAVICHGGDLLGMGIELLDSQGEAIGGFSRSKSGGLTILDAQGHDVATSECSASLGRWVSCPEGIELGTFLRDSRSLKVQIHGDLADQPLTKLLLLSGSLTMGYFMPDR